MTWLRQGSGATWGALNLEDVSVFRVGRMAILGTPDVAFTIEYRFKQGAKWHEGWQVLASHRDIEGLKPVMDFLDGLLGVYGINLPAVVEGTDD